MLSIYYGGECPYRVLHHWAQGVMEEGLELQTTFRIVGLAAWLCFGEGPIGATKSVGLVFRRVFGGVCC